LPVKKVNFRKKRKKKNKAQNKRKRKKESEDQIPLHKKGRKGQEIPT